MALRKCPGCKNLIAAETESCPICGCNPRTRRFRKYLFWGAVAAATGILLHGQLRPHAAGLDSSTPVQVLPNIAAR